jgi:hypothetical protein
LHRLPAGSLAGRKSAVRCKGCGRRFILVQGGEGGLLVLREESGVPAGDRVQETAAPVALTELPIAAGEAADACGRSRPGDAAAPAATGEENGRDESLPAPEILRAFPALQNIPLEHFALEELFGPPPKGGYRTRRNRLKVGLLLAVAARLDEKILLRGEMVCKIARGSAYFPFEIPYANGLLTLPANYYALIATTHRLLLINLDFRGRRPARYTFQILYDEIGKISRGLLGTSLIIKIRNGGKWNFTTVKRSLARELAAFVKARLNGPPSGFYDGVPRRRQLCPACLQPLTGGLTACPSCLAPFKSAGEAMKRSLLLPGTGEIYLDHYLPGAAVLLGYLAAWLVAVVLIIVAPAGGVRGAALLLLAYHLLAGLLARRLGGKGYLTAPPGRQAADAAASTEQTGRPPG